MTSFETANLGIMARFIVRLVSLVKIHNTPYNKIHLPD